MYQAKVYPTAKRYMEFPYAMRDYATSNVPLWSSIAPKLRRKLHVSTRLAVTYIHNTHIASHVITTNRFYENFDKTVSVRT